MPQPLLDSLSLRVGHLVRRRHQGQLKEMRIANGNVCLQSRRPGGEEAVGEYDVQLQNAVVILVPEKTLLPLNGHHARQMRICQWRTHGLRKGIVRLPECADFARAPRLLRDPLLSVKSIARFVDVRVPFPLGSTAAPAVRQYTNVTARHQELGYAGSRDVITQLKQGRETPLGIRSINIGS